MLKGRFHKKDQVKRPHKTILGHPKHVLHLVPSPIAIAEAFNVMCVWVAVPHQYQISKKKILGHFSIRKNTKLAELHNVTDITDISF